MFAILLSILLTTCILSTPATSAPVSSPQSIPWNELKANKSLERFQSTLLNETLLPFLNECYTNLNSSTNNLDPNVKEVTCSRYFDAIFQLNNTDYVVEAPTVMKILNQDYAPLEFCQQKHSFPATKHFSDQMHIDLNSSAACGLYCLHFDTKPHSICKFLAWLGELIKTSNINSKTIVGTTPVAVFGPVAAQPNSHPDLVDSSIKTAEPIDKTKKSPKADANVKNETPASSNIQSIAGVAAVAAAAASSNVSAESRKINPTVLQSPSANEKGIPKENPISDLAPVDFEKEEKIPQKTVDKELQKTDYPKSNSNTQVDIPQSPNNAETPDSIEKVVTDETQIYNTNDSEEDIGDDADGPGIKTKVAIEENYEKERDQKSSQEIDNSNFIQTTKKEDPFTEESGSNFFTYFLIGMFLCIALYVIYHNKSKVLALLLEGRRGDKARSGRRKHTAAYRKLDSNLEEAITSSASGRTNQIIY